MLVLLIISYILSSSSALILLKLGSVNGPPISVAHGISLNLNPYVVTGFVLYGLSFLIYTYLISKLELGFIIPLTTAFVYVFIFTASYFIFHEVFTPLKVTAISLIVLGIIMLNFSK